MSERVMVERAAFDVAELEHRIRDMRMSNVGLTTEDRIRASANLAIAEDRLHSAKSEYRRLYEEWERDGFRD